MKTFAIVFAVCLVSTISALNDAEKAKLKEHTDLCIAETGVDAAKVTAAKKGELSEADRADEKLACFAECVFKKIGIMNADGSFNEGVTRSKIPADVATDKAEELIQKCKTTVSAGVEHCENGRQLFKCYVKHRTFSIFE